jgi:hypothetical protein
MRFCCLGLGRQQLTDVLDHLRPHFSHRYSRLSLLIRRPRVDTPPATEPALS